MGCQTGELITHRSMVSAHSLQTKRDLCSETVSNITKMLEATYGKFAKINSRRYRSGKPSTKGDDWSRFVESSFDFGGMCKILTTFG